MIQGMLLEGSLLLVGLAVGYLLPRRHKGPPFPCVGCNHGFTKHDEAGPCREIVRLTILRRPEDMTQDELGYARSRPVRCACTRFLGPTPPEVIVGSWEHPRQRLPE